MTEQPDIDIKENYIKCLDVDLLSILLKDRSSGKNIIWATDTYVERGQAYDSHEPITVKLITGRFGKVIRPRTDKSKKEQQIRIKDKAEVFTPSWICNEMNNHFTDSWFNKKNIFNTLKDKKWKSSKKKIEFNNDENKTWKDFVCLKVLEISCGEAPFLVSRYDTTTGEWIDVGNRVGALDRKLRIVNENTTTHDEWLDWTFTAIKNTYGYEWQGDSLLIARENILFAFIDYYIARFDRFPIKEYLLEVAKILSWNIWQMDGLKYVIPCSCKPAQKRQLSLFEEEYEECFGCQKNDNSKHLGTYCKIMNWETKRTIKFYKGEKRMKFDFVIGNPPYQGENHQQIYTDFYLSGRNIGNCVEMIFPIGWQEPKNANNLKKLNNPIIKEDSQIVFIDNKQNVFTGIAGAEWTNVIMWKSGFDNGLAGKQKLLTNGKDEIITHLHYDNSQIEKPYEIIKLSEIVKDADKFVSISEITSSRKPYGLATDIINPMKDGRPGTDKYNLNPLQMTKQKEDDIKIYCIGDEVRYAPRDYTLPKHNKNIDKYKVFIPYAWGNMSEKTGLGGAYSNIIIASPYEICTETYLESGSFKDLESAKKHAKYLMTKFARALLYVNKFSQHSTTSWGAIPVQTYNEEFWNGSIEEIDDALMRKYNVPEEIQIYVNSNIQTKNERNIVNYHGEGEK